MFVSPFVRRLARGVLVFLAYSGVAALVCAPIAAERAVERVRFEDRLATLPVSVTLAHNEVSTLDTGVLGRLYWDRTGVLGFGAYIRSTGPPTAGGTLASYASPQFVRANARFLEDPGEVNRVYGEQLRRELMIGVLWSGLWTAVIGGGVLTAVFRARSPFPDTLRTRSKIAWGVLSIVVGFGISCGVAGLLFTRWDGNVEITDTYPMPGVDELSFSSPQALEVARQIQPFIEKNTERVRARAARYEEAAVASLRAELPGHIDGLAPRSDERIVLAEADPQGSLVGTRVRKTLYALLQERLQEDAIALRSISGDISSNGTVLEAGFVRGEAEASPGIPTVVVKGDHDTEVTVDQLLDADVIMPDFQPTDVAGLTVVAADDPAFKALFGGLVINETGVTENELGENLRDRVNPDEPVIVLLHQPRSAAGYIGVGGLGDLDRGLGRERIPWDDGISDLPPGAINIGHLHDPAPPRVIWNTDGGELTWTVVNQLGTSGGVLESPTLNRFSTPGSAPLKTLSVQLQYFNLESGLQTGYASIEIATDGTAVISDRADLGLPGGIPGAAAEAAPSASRR